MSNIPVGAIILGAGKGTRMKSALPKVLMPVDGKPMIRHILDTLEDMNVEKIVTVIAPDGEAVKREVAHRCMSTFVENCSIEKAVLGGKAGVLGAAALAITE